jgi:hypothetical protein
MVMKVNATNIAENQRMIDKVSGTFLNYVK